ncbi:unnamed protein product [Heterosigma akashiwo]
MRWKLFTESDIELEVSENGLAMTATAPYSGVMRAAYSPTADFDAVLETYKGAYPVGGLWDYEVAGDYVTYTYNWTYEGTGPLLMGAIKHQSDILANDTNFVQKAAYSSMKGPVDLIEGDFWTLSEKLPTITWTAPRNITDHHKIRQIQEQLAIDVAIKPPNDANPYFAGKVFCTHGPDCPDRRGSTMPQMCNLRPLGLLSSTWTSGCRTTTGTVWSSKRTGAGLSPLSASTAGPATRQRVLATTTSTTGTSCTPWPSSSRWTPPTTPRTRRPSTSSWATLPPRSSTPPSSPTPATRTSTISTRGRRGCSWPGTGRARSPAPRPSTPTTGSSCSAWRCRRRGTSRRASPRTGAASCWPWSCGGRTTTGRCTRTTATSTTSTSRRTRWWASSAAPTPSARPGLATSFSSSTGSTCCPSPPSPRSCCPTATSWRNGRC